jgi:mono/diheme cytochrome c family protein
MSLKKIMWGQPPSAVQPGKVSRVPHFCRVLCGRSGDLPRLLLVAIVAVSTIASFAQKPAAKPTEDLPAGPMQAKATTSCLECHEARIILQQRLSKGAWTKEVDKMVKWGAVVDAADHDALVDYLSTNFSPDQPPYDAARTSFGKKAIAAK